jgi:anti-sigma factor RsiW
MELQAQDIAMLEAYLLGELSGDALRDCEARLAGEPELASALEVLRGMDIAAAATAKSGLRMEMKAAQTAALAAGMEPYSPAINAPKRSSFLGRLFRFLLKLALTAGVAWVVWKYVLKEQWPLQMSQSTEQGETKTTKTSTKTIKRDTIRTRTRVPNQK